MNEELTTRLFAARPDQLLGRRDVTVVDLRAPREFEADHVAGAHNAPLFDDDERALVGTLYRQLGQQPAFEAGVKITVSKIAALVARIAAVAQVELPSGADLDGRVRALTEGGIHALETRLGAEPCGELPERALVLCCWRGGLRSQSVAALVQSLGIARAVFVDGGYKAWRGLVRERLGAWRAPRTYVLRGLTGVGKTLVLRELERLRPGLTLDLEGLAGHRSSILGMVGLEPVSQKAFDRRLFERLEQGFPGSLVVEGESRKVGDVILPPSVWSAIEGGIALELSASVARRVEVLIDDYLAEPANRAQLARQLPFIERRLGERKYDGVLTGLLEAEREEELVELLLAQYYDPLYTHSERGQRYLASFDASEPEVAAAEIAAWVETHAASSG